MTLFWKHGHRLFSYAVLLVLMAPAPSFAQDVELNPNIIAGSVQLASETLNSVRVQAQSGELSALTVSNPDATTASYSLTVQVEAGGSRTYRTFAEVFTDGANDRFVFPAQDVTVNDGATSTADFIETNPGFIEGTITVTGGLGFESGLIRALDSVSGELAAETVGVDATTLFYKFPVTPGTYDVDPRITLEGGVQVFPADQPATVVAGQTTVVDFTIAEPAGSISGTVDFAGPSDVDRYQIRASGPVFNSELLFPPFGSDNSTAYSVGNLDDGTYSLIVSARLNDGGNNLRFPAGSFSSAFSPPDEPQITAGSNAVVDVSGVQAFIGGTVNLSGTVDPSELDSGRVRVIGVAGTGTDDGNADSAVDPDTGDYEIVVTDGEWSFDTLSLNFFRSGPPQDFLNESLVFRDTGLSGTSVTLLEGETATQDFDLALGSVTVNFTVAGGGLLSDPRLQVLLLEPCELSDASNQLVHSYTFNSTSSGQIDVSVGQVTFLGPEAHCPKVRARALVNGSFTTLGELTIDVVPGADQVLEPGSPSLAVDLEPGQMVDLEVGDTLTVTGAASDDDGVASVSVNGSPAALAPGAGAADVTWQVGIPVTAKGPLDLFTEATDDLGNTRTDTRTVFIDAGPPTVSFTPADGSQVASATVTVDGTVTDDAGIQSVTVNGDLVTLTDQGGGVFGFSIVLTLQEGENFVTVVATDISNKTTTETHAITVVTNQPPTADAGGPYSVPEGGSTVLDGATGSDPDGDSLTFEWDLDGDMIFETPGEAPTFDASALDGPSSRTVTLRVADGNGGEATSTAVVDVTNADPVVDAITAPLDPVQVGTEIAASVTFSDAGTADTHSAVWDWGDGSTTAGTVTQGDGSGSVTDTHVYSTPGVHTLTVTVTDDDGGVGESEFKFVVVYDPDGGFVTGGGTIDSPPGAYTADPSLTGQANFGFVSKYKKGAEVPTGVTQFQFQTGDLNFHSNTYEWLVVAGARAQYKGTGTINGSGSYRFLLTAIDGQISGGGGVDKFRMKITDGDDVVYDNQLGADDDADPTTALSGGSIVIHDKGGKK